MVNWTAEKDQTILRGIFAFHDIKNSQAFLDYLANEIGEGCTPKAVSHRLTNLRKSGKPVNSSAPSSAKKTLPTPRTPRTPASARGRAKFSSAKKVAEDTASEGDDDAEPVASPSVGRKRVRTSVPRKSYVESDVDGTDDDEDEFVPISKKVKSESVDEEQNTGSAGDAKLLDEEEEDEGVAFV